MKAEELLKNISNLLKKHEDFFNNNPELFYAVEGRLLKALDDEDEQDSDYDWTGGSYKGEGDEEDEDGNGYGDDLFDRVPSEYDDDEERNPDEEDGDYSYDEEDGDDEASKWLREHGAEESDDESEPKQFGEFEDEPVTHADEDEAVKPQKPAEEKQKRSSSRYVDWKPRADYEPKHSEAIKKYTEMGYSPREAERFANAHRAPTDFYSALKHSTNPSEPSPKMLELMRGKAGDWLKNAERKHMEMADASLNPIKHASGKAIAAHDAAHKDFNSAYNNFLNSDEVKDLKGRDRHQAIQSWKKKWNEENPEYTQAAVSAAGSGKALSEALSAREKRRDEGMKSILESGKTFGSASTAPDSEEFENDFGHPSHMDDQVAAQSIGGEKNEGGGYSTNIKKDPSAIFAENKKDYIEGVLDDLSNSKTGRANSPLSAFRQRNPDYVQNIKNKLNPEQKQRMDAIDSFKNKKS